MKINRVDNEKEKAEEVRRIEVEIEGVRYTITEDFGRLRIHVHGNKLDVMPCCANQITVKGYDT